MHTFVPKNNASRNCHRCKLPLTDAASCNEGIGPICRKLDNVLLARCLPSNVPAARLVCDVVVLLTLAPETVFAVKAVAAELYSDDALKRSDWRGVVKRVEWILSFNQSYSNIAKFHEIVYLLGYVGLVNLWKGEAATGKARVWYQAGMLCLCGPQNKAGRVAFKHIPGAKLMKNKSYTGGPSNVFGPSQAKGKPYFIVPVAQASKFYDCVVAHYPNHEGLSKALEDAATAKEEDAVLSKPPYTTGATFVSMSVATPAPGPVVSLQEVGPSLAYPHGHLEIQVPYKQEFVAMFKQKIAATNRYYLYTSSAWIVDAMYLDTIKELLNEYYPEAYQDTKEKVHPQNFVSYPQHTQAD